MKSEYFSKIFENIQISNFMAIRQVGAELYMRTERQTDGRTDRHDEANCPFS